jgi:outer membrane lipoprotein LolB
MNFYRLTLIALQVVLVSACATTATQVNQDVAEQAYQHKMEYLQGISSWSLDGKLAASNGKDGGSGLLKWQQSGSETQMSFRGSLGKGAWELQAKEQLAILKFADGREYSASTIAQLIEVHMNAKVPVDALAWWVLGLNRPANWLKRDIDELGRINHLVQFGWDVTFSGYELVDEVWLPGKLVARNKDHSVKLAIKEWTLEQEAQKID